MIILKNHCTQPLRGILFDKDGTLLDLAALWRPAAEQTANEVLQHYCRGTFPCERNCSLPSESAGNSFYRKAHWLQAQTVMSL